jgi:hypothetical protein
MTSVCRRRRDSSQVRFSVVGRPSITRLPSTPVMPHLLASTIFAVRLQHIAEQGFVVAEAIQRGGVEEVDAMVERAQQQLAGRLGGGGVP